MDDINGIDGHELILLLQKHICLQCEVVIYRIQPMQLHVQQIVIVQMEKNMHVLTYEVVINILQHDHHQLVIVIWWYERDIIKHQRHDVVRLDVQHENIVHDIIVIIIIRTRHV